MKKKQRRSAEAAAIKVRRAKLYDLMKTGITSSVELGRRLGVTHATILKDRAAVFRVWLAENTLTEMQTREIAVARAEHVQRTAWEAWERSLRAAKRKKTAKQSTADGVESTTEEQVAERRDGDPRWLEVVMKAEERIAKLRGLDAPTKVDLPPAADRYEPPEQIAADVLAALAMQAAAVEAKGAGDATG